MFPSQAVLAFVLSVVSLSSRCVLAGPFHLANNPYSEELDENPEERFAEPDQEPKDNDKKDLFEGDIILDPGLKPSPEQYGVAQRIRSMHETVQIWPNQTLYYKISDRFDAREKAMIRISIKAVRKGTCIKIRRAMEGKPYLLIKRTYGDVCASTVGYTGGNTEMELNFEACPKTGNIQHELLHALGFWHEHSRDDRDNYVTIVWENIDDTAKMNFEKGSRRLLHLPYDYESILHYHEKAFSKNNQSTIIPHVQGKRMGQRYKMTAIDKRKLNYLYGCQNSDRP